MGHRVPITDFPSWTHTVGSMLDAQEHDGRDVRLMCSAKCSRYRAPDLRAIITTKGRDYSLVNKRFRCRWKPHCTGWIRPYFQSGVMRPLWDDATGSLWIEVDEEERVRRVALKEAGMMRLGLFRDRFDAGVVDDASALTTEDLDVILGRRVR